MAVVGGGIAGVSAACAAARSGASVILVERFGVTGGVLTSGGVANFSGGTEGLGEVFDKDDKRSYILSREEMVVPAYQIPLRALFARDGLNL